MSIGAERAEAPPQQQEWASPAGSFSAPAAFGENVAEEEAAPRSAGTRILATLLLLLAAGWLAIAGYALSLAWPGPRMIVWTGWIATISAPLILLALTWLVFGRSTRRETERFTRAVAAMRQESQALEIVLGIVATRLQDNRAALGEEAARLMTLGDEASDRLGRVTHYLARETAELDRKAQALDAAAANARVDIGALMSDLPRAEEQARAAAEAMKAAGVTAHEQAAALEGQLAALTARSREADEGVGGAAQRLGAQVARIESSTGAASERIDQAAAQMNAAVDGAMSRASDAVDRARGGIEAQGQSMLAMIEQSRAGFEKTGVDAVEGLSARLAQVGNGLDRLAGQLEAQERSSRSFVDGIAERLAEIEGRIEAIGRSGDQQGARLSESLAGLHEATAALQSELEQGSRASDALIGRSREMSSALAEFTGQLRDELPAALAGVQSQAERTEAAVQAVIPSVEAVQAAAALTAGALADGEASVARQSEALSALLSQVQSATAAAEEQLKALGGSVAEVDGIASRLTHETSQQLVDSLVRVRETANQAAANAREAIAAVIPESAAALADRSREVLAAAVVGPVQEQLAAIEAAGQRATEVARQASERLTRQLLAIGETAALIEERVAQDQAQREEKAAENLTRRVSLLIEALNSTAIDVNKILSNEVADTAWAAYLKGDRGVFTRRAVRLLDSGEAREIQRHYEEEPDFREQVNRYVHDFETMLRRVLAERDGATLGVTLLSSDMGKLYVALSQGIERLRR